MKNKDNIYEVGYLLKTNLKEEDVLMFSDKLKNAITEKSGLIISEGKTKKEVLAYPIKKEASAFFNWIKFSTLEIVAIKNYLDKQEELLRFLVIKSAKKEQKPTTFKPTSASGIRKNGVKKFSFAKKDVLSVKEEEPLKKDVTLKELPPATGQPEDEKIKEEEIDKKIEELLGE